MTPVERNIRISRWFALGAASILQGLLVESFEASAIAASVRHVQQLLGHRDLNTTEIYPHLELGDLQRAIDRAARL